MAKNFAHFSVFCAEMGCNPCLKEKGQYTRVPKIRLPMRIRVLPCAMAMG